MRNLSVSERRKFLEKKLKINLENLAKFTLDPKKIVNRHCENMIGATQIPLGIAGPLKIQGEYASEEYYLPLATTEGALVASVNRGCKAIRESGGAQVMVEQIGATRAPVFKVKGLEEAKNFIGWVEKHFNQLKRVAKRGEPYLCLLEVQPVILGKNVYLRFVFDTREAMGMNMVTIATQQIIQFIKAKVGIECISLSGNVCTDKKPSWQNVIRGRGKRVWAEVILPQKVVRRVLKTNSEKLAEVVYRKCLLGSAVAGALGFNGHFANVIAAIFLATGQDLAHVAEGSLGITTAELIEREKLHFNVYLPDLMIGTVGGGTGLPTQKEALNILGLGKGTKDEALKFAEIIAGAVLAGELSLTAALASGDLARAHERLGRDRSGIESTGSSIANDPGS